MARGNTDRSFIQTRGQASMPGAETLSRRLVSDEARKGSRSHSMLINFTGNGHPRDELQVLGIHGPVKHSSWVNSHDFKLPRYRIWLVQRCRGCPGWFNQQVGQGPGAAGAQHCEHEQVGGLLQTNTRIRPRIPASTSISGIARFLTYSGLLWSMCFIVKIKQNIKKHLTSIQKALAPASHSTHQKC